MKAKRILAAGLAAAIALTAAGCGGKTFSEALEDMLDGESGGVRPEGPEAFSRDVWRADVDYSDMAYEPYDLKDLDPYIRAVAAFAEEGGSQEAFDSAINDLYEELYRIYTLYTLAGNLAYADTSDGQLAEEAENARAVYYSAYDEFMLVQRDLALSGHRALIDGCFGEGYADWFESYEPSGEGEDGMTGEESELVARYYALASDMEAGGEEIRDIFVRLVELRKELARSMGYDSYADLAYEGLYGKDYSPEDVRAVWDGAKTYFAPVLADSADRIYAAGAALEADTGLDCSVKRVLEVLGDCAERLSPDLYEAYRYLTEYHLYDLSGSGRKAQIGYTTFLYYYNEPFIFNAASRTFYDYADLMHEFGHFVSYYYNPSDLIFGVPDNDLTELQSQGMSVVMSFLFEDVIGRDRGEIMRDCVLLELALSVVDGAMYDEFQQRVFAEEELTPERVDQIFSQVYLSYGYAPYEGYEREWMQVAHNFEMPFYYISYAVSALGALEINELCEEDPDAGLSKYLKVLSMDPELWYYTEALEEAELSGIFDSDTYEDIADALARSLDTAPALAA